MSRCLTLGLWALLLAAQVNAAEDDPVMVAMSLELNRSMKVLSTADTPAYFIAYRVLDTNNSSLTARFGSLLSEDDRRARSLSVEVRTGSYERDNTHAMRTDGYAWPANYRNNWTVLPLQDDPRALRVGIWKTTDRVYQQAVDHLAKIRANTAVKVDQEDQSADFSREKPVVILEQLQAPAFEQWIWRERVRKLSAGFAAHPDLLVGSVSFSATRDVLRLVNTEGTRVRKVRNAYKMTLFAMVKADDGMEIPLNRTLLASRPSEFPGDEEIQGEIERMISALIAMKTAPMISAYEGPVILEGRASGVFFHELLGHRVEGHRLRVDEAAQTFKKKLGEQILPAGFEIVFDPSIEKYAGNTLMGSYKVDDEGVLARRVEVVSDGVLRDFLMSRTPIEGLPRSNGHGRAQAQRGLMPVSRQSNLFVRSTQPLDKKQIRDRFREALREQGLEWGLLIRDINGGFTGVGRAQPNALKIIPTEVYRLYLDGREELARGVDVIGTPLLTLAHVKAAGDEMHVFHGWCGAESGSVPVSMVAPTVYLDRLEVQRKNISPDRPPLLPNPVPEDL